MSSAVRKASFAAAGLDGSRFSRQFAAQKMGEGEIATIVDLAGEDQRFVDSLERAVRAECPPLKLRKQRGIEPSVPHHSLTGSGRQRPSKAFHSSRAFVEAAARPFGIQVGPDTPKRHPMLSAEALQGLGRAQSGSGVATQDFKPGFPVERMGHRRGVAEIPRAAVRLIDQFARTFDLAQLPHRHSEVAVMRDRLRLGGGLFRPLAQDFGSAPMQRLPAALEQAVVGRAGYMRSGNKVVAPTEFSQRLKLQTDYGQAVMWSKGFAAREARTALARTDEEDAGAGSADERLKVYLARFLRSFAGGELHAARQIAEKSRPRTAQICATSRAGPSRSRRAARDCCKVGGMA